MASKCDEEKNSFTNQVVKDNFVFPLFFSDLMVFWWTLPFRFKSLRKLLVFFDEIWFFWQFFWCFFWWNLVFLMVFLTNIQVTSTAISFSQDVNTTFSAFENIFNMKLHNVFCMHVTEFMHLSQEMWFQDISCQQRKSMMFSQIEKVQLSFYWP